MDLPERPTAPDDAWDPSAVGAQPPETPPPSVEVASTETASPETTNTAGPLAYPATAALGDPGLDFDEPVAVVPVVPYEPLPSYDYTSPPPPKPVGPPKSVLGAVLLNLTGLGLGYAYLRNRALLIVALVGTGALVALGFVTDAAAQPWVWRGVALGWFVVLAGHAGFLASRRASGAAQRKPVLAGIGAVAVVVAGYVGYGVAGAATYDRGLAAQANGDCATAMDAFDTVAGVFELTLTQDVLDAPKRSAECAAFAKAVAAQKEKDYSRAITLYEDFGRTYPHSVLATYVHTNLAETHFAKATSWRPPISAIDAETATNTLLMLRREFSDTTPAKKAPKAIEDVFAEATKPYGEGKFCDSLIILAYYAELDASSVGQKVSADANAYRARSLYECGLGQVRDANYRDGITNLQMFLTAYPNDGGVPQAKSALIAAKVSYAQDVRLPIPPPIGGNDVGPISVTFYNDSNAPVTVLVAGPTAHEVSLPACATCPETYPAGSPAACGNYTGLPSVTLNLPVNTYYFTTDDPTNYKEATGSLALEAGYRYLECVYMSQT